MTVFGAFFSTGIPLPSVSAGCSTSWWRVHERPHDGRDLLPEFRTGADGNADRASPAKLIPNFASPGRRSDDVGPRVRNRMASSRSAGRKLNPVVSGAAYAPQPVKPQFSDNNNNALPGTKVPPLDCRRRPELPARGRTVPI